MRRCVEQALLFILFCLFNINFWQVTISLALQPALGTVIMRQTGMHNRVIVFWKLPDTMQVIIILTLLLLMRKIEVSRGTWLAHNRLRM